MKIKIVYPETTQQSSFYYDTENYFLDKTCFLIIGKNLKYLICIFNSIIFEWSYKIFFSSVTLGTTGFQFNKHAFEKTPIPQISEQDQKPFIDLVDKILLLKQENKDTSELENEINMLVYALYELTDDEIKFIQGTTKSL